MILKKTVLVASILLIAAGCSRHEVPASKVPSAPSAAHVATPGEWQAALASTYTESQREDNNDGTIKFMAMFNAGASKANMLTFGERDAFRKLRIFKAGMPMRISTGVKSYVSILDNDAPVLFLQPYFWGRNGWLFMNKIAVMVDGEVVLERTCPNVQRDTEGVGVAELCDFIASKEDIAALRKIVDSSKVIVRLTGEKGFINLESKKKYNATNEFKQDIQSAVAVYDAIDVATKDHIPPKTPKSN